MLLLVLKQALIWIWVSTPLHLGVRSQLIDYIFCVRDNPGHRATINVFNIYQTERYVTLSPLYV